VLLACLLAIGIWPRLVTDRAETAVKDILGLANAASVQSQKAAPKKLTAPVPAVKTPAR